MWPLHEQLKVKINIAITYYTESECKSGHEFASPNRNKIYMTT
jgi:hypothetical protein